MARSLGRSLSQRGGNRSHLRQAARRRDETANQAGALRAPGHVRSVRCGKAGVRPPCCSRRKASAHLAVLALEELDEVARLVEADAIVYGSPTYMGGPAWQFKKFADATSKPWFVQLASLTPRAGYGVSSSRPTVACSLISRQPGTASSRAGASASRQLQETGALLHQRPATADAFDDAVEAFDLLLAEAVVLGPAEQLQPGPAGDGLALRLGLPAVVPRRSVRPGSPPAPRRTTAAAPGTAPGACRVGDAGPLWRWLSSLNPSFCSQFTPCAYRLAAG